MFYLGFAIGFILCLILALISSNSRDKYLQLVGADNGYIIINKKWYKIVEVEGE